MKNLFITIAAVALIYPLANAKAEISTYIEEMQGLGELSGMGLACNASKYDQFELLARAYLRSKATSDEEEEKGLREYTRAKVNYYRATQMNNFADCAQTRQIFDDQMIFKSVLYGDGTIKTPDGKIITPREPYDARKLYIKDPEIYQKIKEIQDTAKEKNKNVIEKIRQQKPNNQVIDTRAINRN